MERANSSVIKEILDFSYPFFFVNGTVGVGKSTIVNEALNRISNAEENIVTIKLDLNQSHHFIQLANALQVGTKLKDVQTLFDEVKFYLNKFSNLIDVLISKNKNLASIFFDAYNFRDYFLTEYLNETPFLELHRYKNQLDELFEKKIDKRVLLKLFDVLSEAFVYSLIQIKQTNELEQNLKVVFVVDNYEHGAGIVDHWVINHLYRTFYYKTFANFESYEIHKTLSNKKPIDFFDVKFVLISREPFTLKKILYSEPKEKVKNHKIQPYTKEELTSLVENYNFQQPLEEILALTFGIPYAVDYIFQNLKCELNEENQKRFFEEMFIKVTQRTNPMILSILKLISVFDYFTPEAIRCVQGTYPKHEKIFKYLADNSDLCEFYQKEPDLIRTAPHYKFFVSTYLKIFEKEAFEKFQSLFSQFQEGFNALKDLEYEERKIFRNLAYLKEFIVGEVLQNIFQEDYPKVEKFIKENSNLFQVDNDIYKIPKEIREKILAFNKLIDNERYILKIEFIKESILSNLKEIKQKIENLKIQQQQNLDRIKKIQYIKARINEEIQDIQKKIVASENYLIDLNTKRYSTSRKYTWVPFTLLAILSIITFIVGNNILYIFNETMNMESISGLGTALKILSILLFGILLYVLIDHFGSKERKEFIRGAEEFINTEEERLAELKECLNEYKLALKQFDEELQIKFKENQSLEGKIESLEKILKVDFVDAT